MTIIDLPKSEYRRIGEKAPGRWDWIDRVIAVSLPLLFALLLTVGGWRLAAGGVLGMGIWIAGFYWRSGADPGQRYPRV
jgi:hypothetical protein